MFKYRNLKKESFSIRKLAIGAASVLIGASWLAMGQPALADELSTGTKTVEMHAVHEQELTDYEKNLLENFQESHTVEADDIAYYFVYRPSQKSLPNTGSKEWAGLAIAGVGLLVVAVVLSKKSKRLAVTMFALGATGVLTSTVVADSQLMQYMETVQVVVNGDIPHPKVIEGYEFTGYFYRQKEKNHTRQSEGNPVKEKETKPQPEDIPNPSPTPAPQSTTGTPLVQEELPEYPLDQVPPYSEVPSEAPTAENPSYTGTLPSYAESGTPTVEEELPEYPLDQVPPYSEVPTDAPTAENPSYTGTLPSYAESGTPNVEEVLPEYPLDQVPPYSETGTPTVEAKLPEAQVEPITIPYETHYQADPELAYKASKETTGLEGQGIKVTVPTYDENGIQTGTETKTEVGLAPRDKVVSIGNVEKTSEIVKKTETFEADETMYMDNNNRKVKIEGNDGENTVTKTYEVDTQTGELTDPVTKIEEKVKMVPKLTLVGAKDRHAQAHEQTLIYRENPDLEAGETKVIQEGKTAYGGEVTYYFYRVDKFTGIRESIPYRSEIGMEPFVPGEDRIVEVGTKPKVEKIEIPFKTRYEADPNLAYGEQTVVTDGKPGVVEITTHYQFTGTPEIFEQDPVTRRVEPIDRIIKIGNLKKRMEEIPVKTNKEEPVENEIAGTRGVWQGSAGEKEVISAYKVNPEKGLVENEEPITTETVTQPMIPNQPWRGVIKAEWDYIIEEEKIRYEADENLPFEKKQLEVQGNSGVYLNLSTRRYEPSLVSYSGVVEKNGQRVQVNTLPLSEVEAILKKLDHEFHDRQDIHFEWEIGSSGLPRGEYTIYKVGNVETREIPIEVTEERRADAGLNEGETREEAGQAGLERVTITYDVAPETGELRNPVESAPEVITQMKPKIIYRGTKKQDKPHLLPANAALENAVDVTSVASVLRSVDLLNDTSFKSALVPIYDQRDIYTRRTQLQKTNPTITDDQVKEELRKEYLEKLSIKETFDKTKQNIETSLKKVAAHTLGILGNTPENQKQVKAKIEQNKEKILLGLTYINRFYDIDFGNTNIRDILAYNPSSFGKKNVTALDFLTDLGSMSFEELKLTNASQTFGKYLTKITDRVDLKDFLDYNRTTFTDLDGDTWLKQATKAFIVEKSSKENPTEKVGLYTKLTRPASEYGVKAEQVEARNRQNMAILLGLATLKEPSVYAITNTATTTFGNMGTYLDMNLLKTNKKQFEKELEKVKALIEKTASQQENYVSTLSRITKAENRSLLHTNRFIIDTMKKYSPNASDGIDKTWSKPFGADADRGVSHFMTPLDFYSPASRVGAEANGDGVRYFLDCMLDDRGSATYSHEMTHLLDRTVLFDKHGRRDGTAAEFYARGMFENSYHPEKDTYFNLNFVFDESNKDGFYNKKPDRFASVDDLKDYLHGSFDVLYTLDYLEAEASKSLSAEDKAKYFKKILPIPSRGPRARVDYVNTNVTPTHQSEEILALTQAEAEKLTDINSLIDHNILVNRYIIAGFKDKDKISANGYYTVDMFDTIYGVSENDKGISGDITFRKQAFELLAAKGYYEGFVPYVSNQYKAEAESENKPLSDSYIFGKILAGKSFADFKKAEVKERVDKLANLKTITISYKGKTEVIDSKDKMQSLMDTAVREELAKIKAGQTKAQTFNDALETPVQTLKKAIYKAYLRQSNNFRESIYQ